MLFRSVMYNNTDLKRYEDAEKAAHAFFNASDRADYSYLDLSLIHILMNLRVTFSGKVKDLEIRSRSESESEQGG